MILYEDWLGLIGLAAIVLFGYFFAFIVMAINVFSLVVAGLLALVCIFVFGFCFKE